MRKTIPLLAIAIAGLLVLPGCAGSKVGAACYVPWGVAGSCQVVIDKQPDDADGSTR